MLLDNLDREDAESSMREINRVGKPAAAGWFVFNPSLEPEQLAASKASDKPTQDCMHVVYDDTEIERLIDGWGITQRRESVEGFRVVETVRLAT